MKKLIILSVFLLFLLNGNAQNFEKNFIDENYIELTGTSRLELAPDEIYLNIIINENRKNSKLSVEEQERLMISTLKSISIETDDNLKVIDYSSRFKYFFLKKTDIRKTKVYELKLTNGKEVGEVYLALENIGISNITVDRVHHSEYEQHKLDTKVKAIKMAKKKAESYVEAIGQQVGKALFIKEVEHYNSSNYNLLNEVAVVGYGNRSNSSEYKKIENIEFQNIVIDAKVLVRFKLN